MGSNISRDLKKWRLKAELTQEQLAEKVGVARETVIKWEDPEQPTKWPKGTNCLKLSHILGVNITTKGIIEDHITKNMAVEKKDDESSIPDKAWYQKTIETLLQLKGEYINVHREVWDELKGDKDKINSAREGLQEQLKEVWKLIDLRIELMEKVDTKQDRLLIHYREEIEKLREKLAQVPPNK